jgi:hypothetical protein
MTTSDRDSTGVRPPKQELLPQISQLAQEGLSSREIGKRLGLPKSTVGRWLRAMRRDSATKPLHDPAEAIAKEIEFYQAVRDEAIEAWRLSRTDKTVRLVEKTGPADDPAPAKKKKSIRTETRSGDSNLLTKAMQAQEAINELNQRRAALQQGKGNGASGEPNLLADLTDDDLEMLTPDDLENMSDDQLFAIIKRLHAKHGLTDPLLTKQDLDNMTDEQLTALELKSLDEIDRCHEAPER